MSEQKNVLIFGGVGGIGEALARRLRAPDARVTLTSRSPEKAAALANAIGARAATVDVLDEAAITAAVAEAARGGVLHGLAYCVGSIPLKPLSRISATDMIDAYRLNVVGAMLAVRAATDALKAGSGAVLLFSSIAASQGFANHVAVGAAKAGVEGLTLALAAELAPNVRVNAIAPSLTKTPLAASLTSNEAMVKAIAALHPIPRLGEPGEMAALAAFLLSPDAGWITGQVIAADGGRSTLQTGRR